MPCSSKNVVKNPPFTRSSNDLPPLLEYPFSEEEIEKMVFAYGGQALVDERRQLNAAWADGSWQANSIGVSFTSSSYGST
jgi:hypothetical protein